MWRSKVDKLINKLRHIDVIFSKSTRYRSYANSIRHEVFDKSPVDTGRFRNSWVMFKDGKKFIISNNCNYAYYMEEGSIPGEFPWPGVGRRTVMFDGRIYSSQAPGGVFLNALTPMFRRNIASKYLKVNVI